MATSSQVPRLSTSPSPEPNNAVTDEWAKHRDGCIALFESVLETVKSSVRRVPQARSSSVDGYHILSVVGETAQCACYKRLLETVVGPCVSEMLVRHEQAALTWEVICCVLWALCYCERDGLLKSTLSACSRVHGNGSPAPTPDADALPAPAETSAEDLCSTNQHITQWQLRQMLHMFFPKSTERQIGNMFHELLDDIDSYQQALNAAGVSADSSSDESASSPARERRSHRSSSNSQPDSDGVPCQRRTLSDDEPPTDCGAKTESDTTASPTSPSEMPLTCSCAQRNSPAIYDVDVVQRCLVRGRGHGRLWPLLLLQTQLRKTLEGEDAWRSIAIGAEEAGHELAGQTVSSLASEIYSAYLRGHTVSPIGS